MPYSWVTAIELNEDNTISLNVRVSGFEPGVPVEISGYATQDNGADNGVIATFYDIQKMPDNSKKGADMNVKNVEVAWSNFNAGNPIVVVARAADVWITTLGDDGVGPRTGGIKAGWKSAYDGYHSALYTDKEGSRVP